MHTGTMPPTGGPRTPMRVIATSTTNADDIRTYDSLSSAAKALGLKGHNALKKAIEKQQPIEGFIVAALVPPQPETLPIPVAELQDTFFTFRDDVDEMFRGRKVRYTKEQPVKVSVFDIIKTITATTNPRPAYTNLQLQYPAVVNGFSNFQFPGMGERLTPVCKVNEMIEIINVLPGPRAARFRQAGAKVLVRYLGGDESLIDEIRENAQKQEEAATDPSNHMNMFQLPDGLTGMNAACSVMLSPTMQGKTVADMRGPCTYIIVFEHAGATAIKFGWTKNLKNRVKDHYRAFPNMRIWCAIDCRFTECAEQTEQLFKGKMSAYLQTVQLETRGGSNKNHTEILVNVQPERAEQALQIAYSTVCSELSLHNPMLQKELEIQSLRLKLELEATKAHAETEKAKAEAERVKAETAKLQALLELKRLGVETHDI